MQQAHLLLHPRERSRIQIQRIFIIPDSSLSREVSPRCHPPTRHGIHLSASLENSTLRQVSNFFLSCLPFFPAAVSFTGSEEVIRFFADEELAGTIEDRFIAVDLDVASQRVSFCYNLFFFLLFLHPLRHLFGAAHQAGILSAASRAEMADVEQMKKIVPLITCEIAFGQNVCELMFGVNVPNLNLGIQINSVKQPIHINSVRS